MTAAFVGCVLAGGKSSRMGRDKAFLTIGGVTLIEHAILLLQSVFPSVVVSAARHGEYPFLDVPVLPDLRRDAGPLGGIHAALTVTNAEHLFVLACDMPFVSPALIRHIVARHADSRATVVSQEGGVQPLCGVYSRNGLAAMRDALDGTTYKLHDLLRALDAAVIPVTPDLPFYHPSLLMNINDPADLERAAAMAHFKTPEHPVK